MKLEICYENDTRRTKIIFTKKSFKDGDIEHFKTLCCDLCMPYGFIENWFYEKVFSEFLKNINSKDKYIISIDINNKILYGKHTGKLKEI